MVLWQLRTLDHLNTSEFGRPFPRHGLQLLFWFSNHCVSFELNNSGDVMKLVSECQPEKGVYGFHKFGNVEELLPVLYKPKKNKSIRQLVYFIVGNLNTFSPGGCRSAPFVTENHGMSSRSNSDRIIISYQVKTRVVEKVYVTEHDYADIGQFRSDGTHGVSPELIRVLQNPQLDLSSFLTEMGYYEDEEMFQDTEEMQDPSVQMTLSMMQNDPSGFFSEAFGQQLNLDQLRSNMNTTSSGSLVQKKKKKKKSKSNKKQKVLRETYWHSSLKLPYRDFDEDYWTRSISGGRYGSGYGPGHGSGGGGGFSSFLKILVKVGVIYLAAKCFRWLLRNLWSTNWDENLLHMSPCRSSRFPSFPHTHIMLDYVY